MNSIDLIISIFLGLGFFLSIAWNIFQFLENREKEDEILSFTQLTEDLKSRAIKLAKGLQTELAEKKEMIELMKSKKWEYRLFKNFYYAHNRKK